MTDKRYSKIRLFLCLMFFVSGFCALLYQTIWLRLAFAKFGAITPVVSLIISVFMLGLGTGSWMGGQYAKRLKHLFGGSAITLYGIIECLIGTGAFFVPLLFNAGANLCKGTGEINSWLYLISSALMIVISILPFATAMGSTYPVALEFLREYEDDNQQIERNFGLLYAANTVGAALGVIATVFVLIEMLGFNRVLALGAFFNFIIGIMAIVWGKKIGKSAEQLVLNIKVSRQLQSSIGKPFGFIVLFAMGFCSMAMEVIWTRSFLVPLGTMVYSFANLLVAYLISTFFGAFLYRQNVRHNNIVSAKLLIALATVTAVLPLAASNPAYFNLFPDFLKDFLSSKNVALGSIMPFCAVLGYLTPLLIDEISCDNPTIAGKAYAINILGCIMGPLLAGYIILPCLGARVALILFVLPLLILTLISPGFKGSSLLVKLSTSIVTLGILCLACFWLSWEEGGDLKLNNINDLVIHRDYAATTISFEQDKQKMLAVNGQAMTTISKITKYMSHLPLVFNKEKPKSVLVICFGMGTSFRSALTWDCKVTVVEIVPGVRDSFAYYHPDAEQVLHNPNGRIVIDDGRRFLNRTEEKYDAIIVDPPPPLASSATGLLYSKEFFQLIKKHLTPNGILQEWFGFSWEPRAMRATLRALTQEFPYVRMYTAIPDPTIYGYHFLASQSPIESVDAKEFYSRLPDKAKSDLMEWLDSANRKEELKQQIAKLLSSEILVSTALAEKEKEIVITDDYPYNEYSMLDHKFDKAVYLPASN